VRFQGTGRAAAPGPRLRCLPGGRARRAGASDGETVPMSAAGRRVLVVEDERDIAHLLALHLRDLGCVVDVVGNGMDGFDRARSGRYDLVILDLMLPRMDGLELCRRLRGEGHATLVLMLTAKSAELDRVLGLELGADDYLTKPFSIPELLARVKALFRRAATRVQPGGDGEPDTLEFAGLRIDRPSRSVLCAGLAVDLTAREFDLLYHFACHPGRVFTRTQLLDQVWGFGHDSYEHTVNSHINRLRAKVEPDPANPRYVLTVRGVGYKFLAPGG
jgi:DNA-binding response OmpR family regulator